MINFSAHVNDLDIESNKKTGGGGKKSALTPSIDCNQGAYNGCKK